MSSNNTKVQTAAKAATDAKTAATKAVADAKTAATDAKAAVKTEVSKAGDGAKDNKEKIVKIAVAAVVFVGLTVGAVFVAGNKKEEETPPPEPKGW